MYYDYVSIVVIRARRHQFMLSDQEIAICKKALMTGLAPVGEGYLPDHTGALAVRREECRLEAMEIAHDAWQMRMAENAPYHPDDYDSDVPF